MLVDEESEKDTVMTNEESQHVKTNFIPKKHLKEFMQMDEMVGTKKKTHFKITVP